MKKILITVVVFAISLWAVNTYAPIHGEEKIYESVVRLHVIANSDSEEDQALKLKVRDAVLEESKRILSGVSEKGRAEEVLQASVGEISECATRTVQENGFDYSCTVSLSKEKYPEKSYESICFPSGEYTSLQVKIGKGEGKNWWCVLFPQLCISASASAEEMFTEVGLTPDQYKIITQSDGTKYRVRFKLLELIEETVNP